jgi:hypothetical protein
MVVQLTSLTMHVKRYQVACPIASPLHNFDARNATAYMEQRVTIEEQYQNKSYRQFTTAQHLLHWQVERKITKRTMAFTCRHFLLQCINTMEYNEK